MKDTVYVYAEPVAFLSAVVAGMMGFFQLTDPVGPQFNLWVGISYVFVAILVPVAISIKFKIGTAPTVIGTCGQAGILVVPLVLGDPRISFGAAALAAFLAGVIWYEKRAKQRSAPVS